MVDDAWDKLLALKTDLLRSSDIPAALTLMPDDQAVIDVYLDDVEQAMFIVAANRMADLLGIEVFRLDVEDGRPQMVFGFGTTVENAKKRIERVYAARQHEVELGMDED